MGSGFSGGRNKLALHSRCMENFNPDDFTRPGMNRAEKEACRQIMDWKNEPRRDLYTILDFQKEPDLVEHGFTPVEAVKMDKVVISWDARRHLTTLTLNRSPNITVTRRGFVLRQNRLGPILLLFLN